MVNTRICELLGIEHPLISAPMAGTATAELAAAVSEAGGLGMIGVWPPNGPDWLRQQIHRVRERTQRPFGVGFVSSAPQLAAVVQVAIEERVAAISHSFADPTPYLAAAQAVGIKILVQVQKVAHAKKMAQAGVDIITAQGTEAGGHTGYSSTLAIVPAVLDVVGEIPVVAAGGIADGRGVAAMLMLGAQGVWMGTRFVLSREASTSNWLKARAVAASTDDTLLTKAYDLTWDAPFPNDIGDRVLQNDFTATWHEQAAAIVTQREALRKQLSNAEHEGNANIARVQVGNAVGLISSVEPADEIVRRIMAEAEEILRHRPQTLLKE